MISLNQNSNSFSEFYQKFRFLFESWVAVFVTELFTTVYYCLRTCFWLDTYFEEHVTWLIPVHVELVNLKWRTHFVNSVIIFRKDKL